MNDPTSSRSFFLGFPQTSLRPLGDAVTNKNQKEKMNVIGIIVELGIPRMSKGSDYVLIMRIVDQWHHKDEVLVSIFTKKLEDLPQAKHCGDIILLYNIVMRPHEGTPSLVFQKQYSSFALFEGKSSTDLNPYHTSSTFCLKNQDELYVRRARAWSLHFEPDGGGTEYLIYLKDIKDGEFCDLVCKILLVSEVSQDEWVLFVWDGTDAPTLTFDSEQDSEAASLLPSHQDPLSLPREAVCTFPSVGTILRVGGFSDNPGFGQYFQGWNQWFNVKGIIMIDCQLMIVCLARTINILDLIYLKRLNCKDTC
ncbi:hypothetical protein NE237_008733 [Protea cynaroides]|uniref:Protection of telomeres protein 1 n=1 Tax=Protea cynaroides TaxID=273540 RepID=A0A9Q0QZM5_9MAGN|nr:hypothetical protein NE237_008733 [Protea cynaroides]